MLTKNTLETINNLTKEIKFLIGVLEKELPTEDFKEFCDESVTYLVALEELITDNLEHINNK